MKRSLLWRGIVAVIVLVITILYIIPTFMPAEERAPGGEFAQADGAAEKPEERGFLSRLLPDARVSLGLDLKGGINLTLGVEVDKALEIYLAQTGHNLARAASDSGLLTTRPRMAAGQRLDFFLVNPANRAAFEELLAEKFSALSVTTPQETGGRLRYQAEFTDSAKEQFAERVLDLALNTIRNRIDQFGVAEPDIRKQSIGHRLIIQLPGMQDVSRAVQIIGKTAQLEFRLVRGDVDPNGIIPPDVELLPMMRATGADMESNGKAIMLPVEKNVALTGEHIDDANAIPDHKNPGNFAVSLSFDPIGADTFSTVTGENKERRLAIILDGKVYSAPTIQDKISGGQASITGQFTAKEAYDLALVLRSGSLPAPVTILEERTVGPSLGQESINNGVTAALVGGALVILFMIIYYSIGGIVADIMLAFNIAIILAAMAGFGATLTLPGIAGIVLTLGMAVDANVLIYERLREELARGLTPMAAVHEGFSRATLAITDSNLTTVIAAAILYELGTGPIRGFAVTLIIGIVASMFTSIFVSRIIFEAWVSKPGRKLYL